MVSSKQPRRDENTSFSFVDQSAPSTKHPWLKAQPVTLAEIKNLQQERAQKDQAAAEVRAWAEEVLGNITAAGYETLYGFVDKLLNICDQQLSSHVSNMLGQHGEAILNGIRARQPDLVKQWAVSISGELLAEEGRQLVKYL